MFNVRLAVGHLYGKQLFTWLSLVVSLMASFVLSCFPLDVLDEIWDLLSQCLRDFLITHLFYMFRTYYCVEQPKFHAMDTYGGFKFSHYYYYHYITVIPWSVRL